MDHQLQSEYPASENRDSNLHQFQDSFQQLNIYNDLENRRDSQPDMLGSHVQPFREQEQPSHDQQGVYEYQESQHADQNHEGTPSNPSYAQLPLKAAKVLFPQLKESMINSYMVYKVNFVWNDKEFEVARRYSDFKELRKAIKNFLPFTFVFPMHKKQMMVGSKGKHEARVHPRPHSGAQSFLQVHRRTPESLQHRLAY